MSSLHICIRQSFSKTNSNIRFGSEKCAEGIFAESKESRHKKCQTPYVPRDSALERTAGSGT